MLKTRNPVKFLWHYATCGGRHVYKQKTIEERLEKHLAYKTCRIILDEDGYICACCLWNIDDGTIVAEILDLAIREDYVKKDLMRRILLDGMQVWPVKFIKYRRDYTENENNERPQRVWSVERFLRRRSWA